MGYFAFRNYKIKHLHQKHVIMLLFILIIIIDYDLTVKKRPVLKKNGDALFFHFNCKIFC